MNHGPLRIPRKPKVLISNATAATNSGINLTEAIGFKEFGFMMVPHTVGAATPTGFTATFYGTLDPNAVLDNGQPNPSYPAPGAAGGAWFQLPAASSQNAAPDTSNFANPLTAITQALYYRGPALVAVYVALTVAAQTGAVDVIGWATD